MQAVAGVNINFGIVSAIFVTYCFGLLFPAKTDTAALMDDYLWRISYSLQLIPVAITTAIWLFWLKTEPIQYLVTKSEKTAGDKVYNQCLAAISANHEAADREDQIAIYNKI